MWTHTHVPAVATAGVPDSLDREPGVAMVSALGFTAEHYAAARRTSGERAWSALYLGVPSTPESELTKRDWIDTWRIYNSLDVLTMSFGHARKPTSAFHLRGIAPVPCNEPCNTFVASP